MITQSELKVIVNKILNRLNQIKDRMNRYEKLNTKLADWGEVQFDADLFIRTLEKEINDINLCMETYTRPDLQSVYGTKNFDKYVSKITESLKNYENQLEHFLKFEHLPYYYKENTGIERGE